MDDEAAFITRLIGFGLSEKEAHLYLHLLKYGPKTPSPLAKALKTYREDVHRTLTSLIEKGMVRPSLDSPTIYAAVDLDTALNAAVRKQESELREMETRKRELQELSKQQRFRPSDEVSTFKIIKSIKELVVAMLPILDSMHEDWVMAVPSAAAVIASQFGINEAAYQFIERGGTVRVILYDITYPIIETVQEMMDNGEDVRHFGQEGIIFTIFDKAICMSGINADITHFSLNQPIAALWTDDSIYARYLMSTFEMLWGQSVPAAERIKELLKEGPSQA
ncbi:MAG: helix-turn-helix domain-containing protein [Halobacteriota archaeon]|jgi:sugar-specific transcriptional regulator TrmB